MNNHYKRQSVSPCFSGLLNLNGAISSTTFHVRVWIAPSSCEAVYLVTLSPEESIETSDYSFKMHTIVHCHSSKKGIGGSVT